MNEKNLLVLSGKDLKKVLTIHESISAMKNAFTTLYNGEVEVPPRNKYRHGSR